MTAYDATILLVMLSVSLTLVLVAVLWEPMAGFVSRYRARWAYYIMRGEDVMMVRYRVLDTPWGGLYVHHFLRSDADPDLHDHPWNFTSLILTTGYWEDQPRYPCHWTWSPLDGDINLTCRGHRGAQEVHQTWRPRWSLNRKLAHEAHRVQLPTGHTVWTVLWVSPRVREWGFHTPTGWRHWEPYLRETTART